ncbi:SGNH/GDSL hydrolase family protein [Magnetospirillum gryphiswaldense]|uniref:Secreted protein n=1 Tax=Magnetospirillum gryphiswaldense TaxID=55518 RepID=A4U1B6_9PROT|nr:SGNH/GDSL hydrolase family protein [Magnetospirillum gryphiswaldense]AVM75546.1 hypothetical protein MSR1_30800 [Magnetospirillum gryphiswaldense MSR-1]AVM79449.1 hypothetical protein MSR1L_30800 [Magnetospirillum gryphiswaldense]CAM76673.1 secreted protein [Magnetospirillum gryphiswaldense MSR-1]
MMADKSGFLHRLKSFVLILIACAAAALLFEALARIINWQAAPEASVGTIRYGFTPSGLGDMHPDQNGVYTAHPALPYHVRANTQGFRNRTELAADRPLVLALGDSQTFGLFVHAQDVWTDWLEHYLGRDGIRVQVLNNGIPGASIRDEMAYFVEKGSRLGAKIVILCVYVNDIADLRAPSTIRAEAMAIEQNVRFSGLRWFLRQNSALYDSAKAIRASLAQSAIRADNHAAPVNAADGATAAVALAEPNIPFDEYDRLFNQFTDAVLASGAQLIVAFLPGPGVSQTNERIGEFIDTLSRQRGLPFLNLGTALADRSADEIYLMRQNDPTYPSDIHLSRSGHMLVGSALAAPVGKLLK